MVFAARRQVRVAARTTTGTQDITIAGIGTIKACSVELLIARIDNTVANALEWTTGFYDGTRVRAAGTESIDNQALTLTYRAGSTDDVAFLINGAGTGGALIATVTTITDGIRLNWTAVDGLGHFLIVDFYYGDDMQCYVGGFDMANNTGTPNQTLDVTAPGFQPDFIRTTMGPTYAAGVNVSNSIFICSGMAVRTAGGVAQVAMSWAESITQAGGRPSISTSETHFAKLVRDANATPLVVLHAIALDSMLSTGFRVKDTVGTDPPEVGYLAVKWGGRLVYLDKITSPTSASGTVVVDHDTRVQSGLIFGTIADATGDKVDAQAGVMGIGYFDNAGTAEAWGTFETDNALNNNCGTIARTGYCIKLPTDAGTGTSIEATVAFGTDNVTLTYPTVLGTGRLQWIATFEDVVDGTGAVTFPHLTVAGTGYSNKVAGAGAAVFQPFAAAGAGVTMYVHVGTAAVAFQPITAAGVGREVEQGAGAASFAPMSVAGAGVERIIGTGAVTFAPLVAGGAGREAHAGAGAVTFAPLVAAASGTEQIIGSGAFVFAPMSVAGAGFEGDVGVGAASFAPLVVAGLGLEAILGTGAIVFAPEVAQGFGSSAMAGTFVGSGAATFAPFALQGAGLEAFAGASALVFAPVVFGGAGIGGPAGLSGTGALVFPAFGVQGSGAELVVGASGLLFPPAIFAGAGLTSSPIGGTGAVTFAAFGIQGVGIGGIAALTNKKRIYDALMAAARAGLFLRVGYEQGTVTIIEGVPVPPKSVLANETRSTFGVSKRWRRTYIQQRLVWEWELLLQFDKEITAERFERAYCDAPINLPHDPANNLEAVILRLVSSSYSHPPQQQPSNGTRATYRFVADVHPR